jgi:hypothetical protein
MTAPAARDLTIFVLVVIAARSTIASAVRAGSAQARVNRRRPAFQRAFTAVACGRDAADPPFHIDATIELQ